MQGNGQGWDGGEETRIFACPERTRGRAAWHVPPNYSNNKTILIIISTSVWEHTALRRARRIERQQERRTIGERERKREREGQGGDGRKTKRRGHDDRGRIMTIITIYMQVPSLPAHEQSTHSISYLIWIIQTNLSFLPSFLCTLYNPNKRDETSTASRSLFQYQRRQRQQWWRRRRRQRYSSRTPILPGRFELAADSISSSSLLYLYSSLNILFIELTRNRGIHRQLSPIRGSLCAGHERSRLRSAAVEFTCDKLAFLIRIFEQSINMTSIRRNLWRTRSHAIATYLATDIRKLDFIILSTSMSFSAIISHAAVEMMIMQMENGSNCTKHSSRGNYFLIRVMVIQFLQLNNILLFFNFHVSQNVNQSISVINLNNIHTKVLNNTLKI